MQFKKQIHENGLFFQEQRWNIVTTSLISIHYIITKYTNDLKTLMDPTNNVFGIIQNKTQKCGKEVLIAA